MVKGNRSFWYVIGLLLCASVLLGLSVAYLLGPSVSGHGQIEMNRRLSIGLVDVVVIPSGNVVELEWHRYNHDGKLPPPYEILVLDDGTDQYVLTNKESLIDVNGKSYDIEVFDEHIELTFGHGVEVVKGGYRGGLTVFDYE